MAKSASRAASAIVEEDHRGRLLTATLEAIGDVGWTDLTIAEIVRRARVSKRTFYEHFATKDACLLALYDDESARLLDELDAAIELVPCDERQVAAGALFYLARLRERPRVARTLTVEILKLGSEGLAIRSRVMRRHAAHLQREINAAGTRPPISIEVAMVIVGGINELTLEALAEDRIDRLEELAAPIVEVIGRVLHGGEAPARPTRPRRTSPA